MNFKLCVPDYLFISNHVWSPDGTQIACIAHSPFDYDRLVIFDHRRGLIGNDDNEIGWIADGIDEIAVLKFSPDGSFLVSAGSDGYVRVWNFNTTEGYYLQTQGWNISQELDEELFSDIDVSPCCRYLVVLAERNVLLKDVQNNGKTIKSFLLPENEWGQQIKFSTTAGHRSIFISSVIQAN
jgi:WD40 repeat protein